MAIINFVQGLGSCGWIILEGGAVAFYFCQKVKTQIFLCCFIIIFFLLIISYKQKLFLFFLLLLLFGENNFTLLQIYISWEVYKRVHQTSKNRRGMLFYLLRHSEEFLHRTIAAFTARQNRERDRMVALIDDISYWSCAILIVHFDVCS